MAGVSRSTVSHILANHVKFIERFKPETVTRVREIARQLGYTVNLMALSLRAPHPSFFALVLRGEDNAESIAWHHRAVSWHHQAVEAQFQAGALDASRLLGLYPVLAMQDSPEPEPALARIRGVLDGGVLGAVLRRPRPLLRDTLCQHIALGLPVVVAFPTEDAGLPTNCIDLDNEATGRLAAQTLLAAGRRRLTVVQDDRQWMAIRLRAEAFIAAAREGGAQVSMELVAHHLETSEREAGLAARLRDSRPDGIYASSGNTGTESLVACRLAGLRVPEETALVGSDTALWPEPGGLIITSVDVSRYEAGRTAVQRMFELAGTDKRSFENTSLPPRVMGGGTCPVREAGAPA
jgi:LacI family transcriptional regulator